MEKKKPFKKDRKPIKWINKEQELKDAVVYQTKGDGKTKMADWQLRLQAIAICMSNKDGQIIKDEVDKIYQGLIHKGK